MIIFRFRWHPPAPAISGRAALRGAAVGLACLSVCACAGGGGTSRPPAVSVSVLAPTDGATVRVRAIEVVGNVTPDNARVLVGGRPARVVKGAFHQPLILLRPLTHIVIRARAHGLPGSVTSIAVRYSAPPRSKHHAAPQPLTSQSLAQGQPAGSTSALEPNFIAGCSHGILDMVNLCTCVWNRLARAGFDTEAKWRALIDSWRRSFRATGVIVYPPVMKNAVVGCAALARQR